MALVKIPKKIFEKEIGKLNEEMKHKISMFGTPLEAVGEEEIEIEIFPNRPDLISYQGFKRGFLAFLGKKTGLKEYKLNKPEKDYTLIIDSSVKSVWPYAVCAIVKGLKLDNEKIKEIIDIQEKLTSTIGRNRKKMGLGIYPLEKIKLPITYKAIEPDLIKFIPLEMEKEMNALQILQRHPTGREYAHILSGKTQFPVFVDANNQILSMPPIINSHTTGKITENTKDAFVECTGTDLETLQKTLNIFTTTLAEMGGKIYQMTIKDKKTLVTPNLTSSKERISLQNAEKLIGISLKEKEMKNFLERMGHNYKNGEAEVGAWRTDILHEVDLIEDIAIAYGYDKLIPEIPEIADIGEENSNETIKRKISQILNGTGLIEISNYHLTNKKNQFERMGIPEKKEGVFIELEKSKTDYNILRKDLTHYLLKILSENVDSEYPQKIFEIGKIFETENSEKEKLCIALAPSNFTELKQILEYLFRMLDKKISIEEIDNFPNWFIDGRIAKIKIENKEMGYLGEIHPRILKNWKIKMPVALLEIDLSEILNQNKH